MTFGQPLFLWGTLAALIPLLVHLFDRRRPRRVPFGAIAFVLRSQRRTASRLKLKRLLLYALRTLILLAVPLALAQPRWEDPKTAVVARGAAATAIIVDTSLGLRWKDGSTPLFDEVLKQTREAVAELSPEEPATLVVCGRSPRAPLPAGFDKARLVSAVDDLRPSFEVADLNRCLELGVRALDDSPLPNRRLVVVSAFLQSSLRLEAPAPSGLGPRGEAIKPEVVVRDVAQAFEALPNRALVEVKAEPALQAGPRAWQFTFTVRNFGPQPARDVELALKVDGVVVTKGFVDLAPGGTAQKTLTWRFQAGGVVRVEGALTPDALPEDDVRGITVQVPRQLKALVVNGAPNPVKVRDEAFFVEAALSSPGTPVEAVVRDADAAFREDLAGFDEVFLLNVPAPSPEVVARLHAFVEAGGGLFLSLGDRMEPDAWNAAMASLLPRTVRVVKTAAEPQAPDANARAARITAFDPLHPVLSPFNGRAREGLMSTRFYRYALFEAGGEGESEALATLDDGAPLIVTRRVGKGRVFALATSVDTDWTDLPIRTGFLPLTQRVAAWLMGSLDEREVVRARVGEAVVLTPPPEVTPTVLLAPSGAEVPLVRAPQSVTVSSPPLTEPGAFEVLDAKGEKLEALAFTATLDAAGSDLSRADAEAVAAWFGEAQVRQGGEGDGRRATPLWTWLFVAAAVAFLGEGLLLRRP